MKIKSYHILFRLLSYLSDKTNGGSVFVKYKLLLGTLIIGVSGVSCHKPLQTGKQKDAMPVDSLIQAKRKNTRHLAKKDSIQEGIPSPPAIKAIIPDHPEEYFITCYDPVVTYIEDTVPPILPKEEPQN